MLKKFSSIEFFKSLCTNITPTCFLILIFLLFVFQTFDYDFDFDYERNTANKILLYGPDKIPHLSKE